MNQDQGQTTFPCAGCGTTGTNVGIGGIGQAPFSGTLVQVTIYTLSNLPAKVIITNFGSSKPATNGPACTSPSQPVCTANNIPSTVLDVETLSGLSTNTFTTITLASPPTVTNGNWYGVVYELANGASMGSVINFCTNENTCPTEGFPSNFEFVGINFVTSGTPVVGNTYNSENDVNFSPNPWISGMSFLPSSTTSSTISQCFGNCGTPAITLVNTNSTHSINFNTSLTVFYEFQSPLSGVINNVTTNLAKSYSNGQQVSLGIYTTLCNVGITPFTATCPGQQQSLQTFTNPVKGRLSISPSGLTVTVNTWVAIAISSVIAGLDVNDTNLSVNVFQQNPSMPPILAAASANGQSKMGLWAYITGTPTGTQPVVPPVSCGADLLCTLINATCALTPTNCFIGAMLMAFAWSIATTVILLLAVGYLANSFRVSLAIPNGVILIIWFGWFMFFPAIVGAVWFTILMFIFFILAFASFSTFMLKGTSGFGGQTA